MKIEPMNRHILIERIKKEKTEEEKNNPIFIPEGIRTNKERYETVRVVFPATDGNLMLDAGDEIIVNASMIDEFTYKGQKYEIILENYVICYIDELA